MEKSEHTSMENIFVQVSNTRTNKKDILIGVIYRPPNTSVKTFLESLGELLNVISNEGRPCYLLGDFNVNLLNNTANNYSNDFLKVLLNFGFYPRIDRPTRITETTATLIDNIFTNVHETNMSSGIWLADKTDHLPDLPDLTTRRKTMNAHFMLKSGFIPKIK